MDSSIGFVRPYYVYSNILGKIQNQKIKNWKMIRALPKDRITQPKVPQHSTLSSMPPSTPTCDLGLKMHPLTPLQHAHPTPTCIYPTPKCQNRPLEPRIASQKLRFCMWRGFCEIYSTHPATEVCVLGGGTKIGFQFCFMCVFTEIAR